MNKTDDALSLQGTGVYARYQVSSPAALSVRYERLDDEGLFGGIDQVLHEVTATAEYKFAEGFLLRGEFRRDWSNRDFFTTDVPGVLRDKQNTAHDRPGVVVRQQGRRLVGGSRADSGNGGPGARDVCGHARVRRAVRPGVSCRRPKIASPQRRNDPGANMTLLSLLLSVGAFVYLVYAMVRPEKF